MASRYFLARQFRDNLVALIALPLAHLVGIVVVVRHGSSSIQMAGVCFFVGIFFHIPLPWSDSR